MPINATYRQPVYGFDPDRDYSWPQRVSDPSLDQPDCGAEQKNLENKTVIDVIETTKEIAAINPKVGQEILRLLNEPETATSTNTAAAPAPTTATSAALPAPAPTTPTSMAAPSGLATVAALSSPSTDVTATSAIIDVTSPPANPRSPTSRTSPATKQSAAPAARVAPASSPTSTPAREPAKSAPPRAPAQRARLLTPLERHQSRCGICGHNLQDEIDERFINWEHVGQLANEFKIARSNLYRHANATGLFDRRDHNIRRALGRIIHNADHAFTTGDTVVRAVKVSAHINARGEWVKPGFACTFRTRPGDRALERATLAFGAYSVRGFNSHHVCDR
jgi:hypothetical protein